MTHDNLEPDSLKSKMEALDRRVFQLWKTLTFLSLALTVGLGIVLLPEIVRWKSKEQPTTQLVAGLLVLVVLLNIYLWKQREFLVKAREVMLRERTRRELAEALAVVDPLTDSFNRRYMETVVAKEVSRADRLGASLVFIMIDVDNFRSVNTNFGHPAGDRILCDVAELLKQSCRLTDTVVRYGGDEFLLLLSGSSEADAHRVVQRIQHRVDQWNANPPMQGYNLGLSCGLAIYTQGARVNELIEQADRNMYEAKGARQKAAATAGH